jgi:hypothetical protein
MAYHKIIIKYLLSNIGSFKKYCYNQSWDCLVKCLKSRDVFLLVFFLNQKHTWFESLQLLAMTESTVVSFQSELCFEFLSGDILLLPAVWPREGGGYWPHWASCRLGWLGLAGWH